MCETEYRVVGAGQSPMTIQEMYDAAIEAVDYVGQANWQNRQNAASAWLARIRNGKRDLTIGQVDTKLEEEAEARNVVIDDIE